MILRIFGNYLPVDKK